MKLTYKQYRDKVLGCWTGKNIGGVLGAPFEGERRPINIDFYTQDLSAGPPPNDDLDLQIVWLAAVERYGRNVNAHILGEYWLAYIIPNWVEYGTGKANLRAGLHPPLSGVVDNPYKNSCGCFIRSELWACLAPGHPEIAARYAYEDAIVDHAQEGLYGEIFFAAVQSAAFVEEDTHTLLDIGLSYIPQDCAVARCVRAARACHREGASLAQARVRIHNEAPGTFGVQSCTVSGIPKEGNEGMEVGAPGFDAPENIGFTVAGWLYGEGDFGKSLCAAVYFGEDTDCTAATLGATLGIVMGATKLPEKWTAPLDDKIATLCIDRTSRGVWVPDTATQLSERVMRAAPWFLGQELCDPFADGGMSITCTSGAELFCSGKEDYLPQMNGNGKKNQLTVRELCELSPYVVRYPFPAFDVLVDYHGSPFFQTGEARLLTVTVVNSFTMRQQQWATIKLYLPQGVEAPTQAVCLPLNNLHGSRAQAVFSLQTDAFCGERLELIVDVSLVGRHSSGPVKVTLLREAAQAR